MTTSPIVTINDEILNELERASTFTNRFMVEVQPYSLQAILAERAELKRKLAESISLQSRAMQELALVLYSKPYPENNPLLDLVAHIAELKRDAEKWRARQARVLRKRNPDQAMQERQE